MTFPCDHGVSQVDGALSGNRAHVARCSRGAALTALLLLLWVAPAELAGAVLHEFGQDPPVCGSDAAERAQRAESRSAVPRKMALDRMAPGALPRHRRPCRRVGRGDPMPRAPGVGAADPRERGSIGSGCRV